MGYYLHVERTALSGGNVILQNEAVGFDTTLLISQNDGSTDDFLIDEQQNKFGIKHPGSYVIQWYMAQVTGLSPSGQVFGLQKLDLDGNWTYIGEGTSHVKVAATSGFGVIDVTDEELALFDDHVVWFRLKNTSSHDAMLSNRPRVKGALVIYSTEVITYQGDAMQVGMAWDQDDDFWESPNLGHKIQDQAVIGFDLLISESYYKKMGLTDPGIIQVSAPGKYKITWEIPINTIDYADTAQIVLMVNAQPHVISHLPMARGILSGSAVLDCWFDETLEVYLINQSGCIIRLNRYSYLTLTYLCPPSKGGL